MCFFMCVLGVAEICMYVNMIIRKKLYVVMRKMLLGTVSVQTGWIFLVGVYGLNALFGHQPRILWRLNDLRLPPVFSASRKNFRRL